MQNMISLPSPFQEAEAMAKGRAARAGRMDSVAVLINSGASGQHVIQFLLGWNVDMWIIYDDM